MSKLILGRAVVRHLEPEPLSKSQFAQRRPSDTGVRARLGLGEEHIVDDAELGPVVASDDDSHLMTIAPTGAGKGRDVIIPNLLTYEGSVVVIDPKGENYDVTHEHRRTVLGNEIVLLDPFGASHGGSDERGSLNPFDVFGALRRDDDAAEEAEDFGRVLSDILMGGIQSLSDPFWDEMAQLLIAALATDLMTGQPDRPDTLQELRTQLFESDLRYRLAVALDTRSKSMPPGTRQEFEMLLSIADAEKTFSGIVATAAQQLAAFSSRRTVDATARTSFALSDLTNPERRISIYVVIPPHKLRTHQRLLRAWVGCLLYYVMNSRSINQSRLLFLIDEAAQLGRFSLLQEAITLLRGYGLRTWTFWQDLAQLSSLYGLAAETMINNSGVLQVFSPANFGAATALSMRIGCSVGELLQLAPDEQVIAFKNEWPTKMERFNHLTDPVLRGWARANPRHGTAPPPA
ncbi:type IV secretory system conjugative DNA transfer family protein [Micromonospora sp. NPDC049903]|uniref:type IV secretory system conjugative DNA transfer family protein n=1 Tax=Micromonospora sp. NPDC049903 TaxID=3364276 RepID=UPI0037BCF4BA